MTLAVKRRAYNTAYQRRYRKTAKHKAYVKAYYKANKAKYAVRAKVYKAALIALVNEAKAQPCLDCKQTFPPCVMDFDHVRGKKVDNIGRMLRYGTKAAILSEIAKCEVVCSNCHRLRTHKRKNVGRTELSTARFAA